MSSAPGSGTALPPEIRANLIYNLERLSQRGLTGGTLAAALAQGAEQRAQRLGLLTPDLGLAIQETALALAQQERELRAAEGAARGGLAVEIVPVELPGALPGITADVEVLGNIGSGRGDETLYLRLTNLPGSDVRDILAALQDALDELAQRYRPGETATFFADSLRIRNVVAG